ncbi:MAG TPA: 2-amino-4-hydroxy-6-hydroxymethyldihydropteridine diphosphokinase [Dictyobacter sp.]|jgi:2-amino-4-hydroxy-6-hydroxymethyldihydropteridine diphosphokinase|nr:2-amino-4-hydroxy-6-hydroxymethyldihydropteridine diphosphokinase [Dictyobacter sp.]
MDTSTSSTTTTVYLALGSNQGDRRKNLQKAIVTLQQVVTFQRISAIYETDPIGFADQPQFFNLVCSGQTELPAQKLLHYAKETEKKLGRLPTFRNGPRTIDIDILLYGNVICNQPELIIPHPRMEERAFVLIPLVEIAPTVIHPLHHITAAQLLERISSAGVNKLTADMTITL